MRHHKKKAILGRERGPRRALLRGLAESLVLHESVMTTEAKAKALRSVIEPLVTSAKAGTLSALRRAKQVLFTDRAVRKLMKDIAPRFQNRQGGYTRITKLGLRVGDRGKKARIEFV